MLEKIPQIRGLKRIVALGALSAAIAGIILAVSLTTRHNALLGRPIVTAAESEYRGSTACATCHTQEYEAWVGTEHALASSKESFRVTWFNRGEDRSCLQCHTTGYDPQSSEAALEGVSCEECHGAYSPAHPPSVMVLTEEARACGECHWTTYNEWQVSVHAQQSVTCTGCHAVHSQSHTMPDGRLPCASCHAERYEDFAHATHAEVGADCETCHMHTPPGQSMIEGRVSTGHTFTVSADACASCHQDTIHTRHEIPDLLQEVSTLREQLPTGAADRLTHLEEEVKQLRSSAARNLYEGVAAGGVVGIGLGFTAAWLAIWLLDRGRR